VLKQGLERGAVVLAEIGDGFAVRAHAAPPPDPFEMARR